MKKTILALAIIMVFAASSFASVSFMTAPGIGAGKYDLMGAYGSAHMGAIANSDEPQDMDLTALGLKGTYGIMDGLDLVVELSSDTAVNAKTNLDITQTSGSTIGIGVKYSIPKSVNMMPVDAAVLVGYEQTALGFKSPTVSTTATSYALGLILSKQMGMCVPYGGIAVKSLNNDLGKSLGVTVDPVTGTGLMINLGVWVGIAANQAVAIEYDTENDSFSNITKSGHAGPDKDGSATSVSGLSVGYVYMF
jgi:hypothetical protein